MSWITLALICALSLASADAATKAWLRGLSGTELLVVRFCVPAVLLAPLLIHLPPPTSLPAPFWISLAVMVPLELLAMRLYMLAIRDHPLSLTLPYLAFTPVFVIGVAGVLLGERVSARGALGILLVVTGAWLLNAGQARLQDWRSWTVPLTAAFRNPGSAKMLAVAAIYAVTATLGKKAMQHLPPETFGAFYYVVLGATVFVFLVLPRPRRLAPLSERPLAVLSVGGLMAVMVFTHFLAIQQVEVAYMIAVKRLSLVFGILFGALLFREERMATRLPAGLIMVAGVALILI